MWDWVWPLSLGEAVFGLAFVLLPDPTTVKASFALGFLVLHGAVAYWVMRVRQVAWLWFVWTALCALNTSLYTAGLAVLTGFRLRPLLNPEDFGIASLIAVGLVVVACLTWRYYTPLMQELHAADCRTGRFDLDRGAYSLAVLPNFYEFKTPLLRRASVILVSSSGVLTAIAAASSVHGGERLLRGRDLGAGALFLFIAVTMVALMTCAFYTYRWIRCWEKSTGRTMWIKGFEPGADSA